MDVVAAFDWQFIWDNRDAIWGGFKLTMKAAAVGIVGASIVGLVLGLVYLTLVWTLSVLIRLLESHLALPEEA